MWLYQMMNPEFRQIRDPHQVLASSLISVTILFHFGSRTNAKLFATQMSNNVVETQFGKLRGVLINVPIRNQPQVEAYYGLQYASVLNGDLRFMPPTSSLEKWDGVRVALKHRPVCPQRLPVEAELAKTMPLARVEHFKRLIPFLEKQQEECLNLNIYVPVKGQCIVWSKNVVKCCQMSDRDVKCCQKMLDRAVKCQMLANVISRCHIFHINYLVLACLLHIIKRLICTARDSENTC